MAEPPSASLGPRYAPDDATLPKPWIGLIDGSTGLQYYWNPETNVTQYDRPAPAPPPLPPGPPPPSSFAVPTKLASSHASVATVSNAQTVGAHLQDGQQVYQQQSGAQFSYQPPVQKQIYAQTGHQLTYQQSETQQRKHQESYAHQQAGHQFPQKQLSGERLLHQQSGQKAPQQQPEVQVPNQLPGKLLPHDQIGQQQASYLHPGRHIPHQQSGQYMTTPRAHQMPYQNIPYQRVQPSPQKQMLQRNMPQGGFQNMEESPFQHGRQEAYSASEVLSSSGGMPTKVNFPMRMPQSQLGVHRVASEQNFGEPLPGGGRHSGAVNFQIQQNIEATQRGQPQVGGAPRSASQMTSGTPGSIMPMESPMRRKDYGEDKHRMKGDGFYPPRPKDMPAIGMMQPKLAPLPAAKNLQVTRIGVSDRQVLSPVCSSGYSMPPMHAIQSMYDNVVVSQPFPNGVPMGSSPRIAAVDLPHPSAADLYRRQHEVTVMGENIPAPITNFETTGFPPEILSET